jgi:hypothetical protein
MTRQPSSGPSSPTDRRIISSGLNCPGAPVKKKRKESSQYRYDDDWWMQRFDNTETSSPMSTLNWLQPRRQLFPEDGHDDSNCNEQQLQQQQQQQQQYLEPRAKRQLFRNGEYEERQNLSPPRPVRQHQNLRCGGQAIGIVTQLGSISKGGGFT